MQRYNWNIGKTPVLPGREQERPVLASGLMFAQIVNQSKSSEISILSESDEFMEQMLSNFSSSENENAQGFFTITQEELQVKDRSGLGMLIKQIAHGNRFLEASHIRNVVFTTSRDIYKFAERYRSKITLSIMTQMIADVSSSTLNQTYFDIDTLYVVLYEGAVERNVTVKQENKRVRQLIKQVGATVVKEKLSQPFLRFTVRFGGTRIDSAESKVHEVRAEDVQNLPTFELPLSEKRFTILVRDMDRDVNHFVASNIVSGNMQTANIIPWEPIQVDLQSSRRFSIILIEQHASVAVHYSDYRNKRIDAFGIMSSIIECKFVNSNPIPIPPATPTLPPTPPPVPPISLGVCSPIYLFVVP